MTGSIKSLVYIPGLAWWLLLEAQDDPEKVGFRYVFDDRKSHFGFTVIFGKLAEKPKKTSGELESRIFHLGHIEDMKTVLYSFQNAQLPSLSNSHVQSLLENFQCHGTVAYSSKKSKPCLTYSVGLRTSSDIFVKMVQQSLKNGVQRTLSDVTVFEHELWNI